jgi:hypothetical protein
MCASDWAIERRDRDLEAKSRSIVSKGAGVPGGDIPSYAVPSRIRFSRPSVNDRGPARTLPSERPSPSSKRFSAGGLLASRSCYLVWIQYAQGKYRLRI